MKLKRFYELEQDIIAEIERLARLRRQTRTAVIETAILALAEQDKAIITPVISKQIAKYNGGNGGQSMD